MAIFILFCREDPLHPLFGRIFGHSSQLFWQGETPWEKSYQIKKSPKNNKKYRSKVLNLYLSPFRHENSKTGIGKIGMHYPETNLSSEMDHFPINDQFLQNNYFWACNYFPETIQSLLPYHLSGIATVKILITIRNVIAFRKPITFRKRVFSAK